MVLSGYTWLVEAPALQTDTWINADLNLSRERVVA